MGGKLRGAREVSEQPFPPSRVGKARAGLEGEWQVCPEGMLGAQALIPRDAWYIQVKGRKALWGSKKEKE